MPAEYDIAEPHSSHSPIAAVRCARDDIDEAYTIGASHLRTHFAANHTRYSAAAAAHSIRTDTTTIYLLGTITQLTIPSSATAVEDIPSWPGPATSHAWK